MLVRALAALPSLVAVSAIAPAFLGAQSAPLTLEPYYQVGCGMCDGPELFAQIADLHVLPDGSVIVGDSEAPFVRSFAPDGSLRFTALKEGAGPAEARSLRSIAVAPDGRMLTLDFSLRRITALSPEGAVLDDRTLEFFPSALFTLPDEPEFWLAELRFVEPVLFSHGSFDSLESTEVSLDLSGLGYGEEDMNFELFPAAAGPDGRFAVGGPGDLAYRIRVLDRDGTPRYEISRDIPKTPKSETEIAEEREVRGAAMGRIMGALSERTGNEGNAELEALGSEPDIDPEHRYYLVDDLEFDPLGRLWVKTPRGREARTIFDLFGPEGAYLGELSLDARITKYAVGEGYLAGVVEDHLEIQTVQVWRIGTRE